jgi:hypothetical protein
MFDPAVTFKVEKSRHYAAQPERINLRVLEADFHGDNSDHHVMLGSEGWQCHSCDFFDHHGTCVHILTMQRLLARMLPQEQRFTFFDELAQA